MWVLELNEHFPNTLCILVSMKSDLRDLVSKTSSDLKSKGMGEVASNGEAMKKTTKAQVYIECSAMTQYNLRQVFDAAIKVVLHPPAGDTKTDDFVGGATAVKLLQPSPLPSLHCPQTSRSVAQRSIRRMPIIVRTHCGRRPFNETKPSGLLRSCDANNRHHRDRALWFRSVAVTVKCPEQPVSTPVPSPRPLAK
jgi:hypothetical protein